MYDRCRHIRVDGGRCQAMALNGKAFCYFHMHNRRKQSAKPARSNTADYGAIPVSAHVAFSALDLDIPLLEDRTAIQVAITRIVHALAANEIDPKRAGQLLYALQIASSNLRHDLTVDPEDTPAVVLTTSGDEIAPAETIVEEEDLKGHKKSCNCEKCEFVQTDSETHHADCSCGECPSSPEEAGKTIEEIPPAESCEIINVNASAENIHSGQQHESRHSILRSKGWKPQTTSRSSPGNTPRSGHHSKASVL